MENEKTINHYDRSLASLDGIPDVIKTRPTTIREIPPLGLGTNLFTVQTFRHRDSGDTIFLESFSAEGAVRIVLPTAVADAIARQRDQLSTQSRRRAGKARAERDKLEGRMPGFMKIKNGKKRA